MTTHPPSPDRLAAAVDELRRAAADGGVADAAAVEIVGRMLAERLRPQHPDVIVGRDNIDDCVLTHVVCRELDIPAVRVYEGSGLLSLSRHPTAGSRAALLAVAWSDLSPLRTLQRLLANDQVTVVAVAAALPIPEPALPGPAGNPVATVTTTTDAPR
ncbi:hypothetical protein C5N14_07975 [Micromonospora sp. MW-13]|nr:hypothetical protein [Micromonospora sp. NBC_01655]MCX4472506.1 hypothetical protein [Micromonospora sp. NBC_01655]RGC69194.1 hypothetical protein C5N14_07975 [Micromonospora sp. MW-13]